MNINEIESKEELLDLLNKGIDKFGVTKKDINESYASSSVVNGNKKDKVKIRVLSQNEAILKMMVPYGDKLNQTTAKDYPYKISEGKYGFEVYINDTYAIYAYQFRIINKINDIANNLYVFSYNYDYIDTKAIGFTTTRFYGTEHYKDGYGVSFQDNYLDKIENRVSTYSSRWNEYYSKSGNVTTPEDFSRNGRHVETLKTSTAPYAGLWPVLNI